METRDAILARRNVGTYAEETTAPDHLDQILEAARRLLGYPEDRFCAWLISLGLPADRPLTPLQRPNRRPFTDVVHRGHG